MTNLVHPSYTASAFKSNVPFISFFREYFGSDCVIICWFISAVAVLRKYVCNSISILNLVNTI